MQLICLYFFAPQPQKENYFLVVFYLFLLRQNRKFGSWFNIVNWRCRF
jgi:hypothetical protein